MNLPFVPPPAYWNQVPWWAFLMLVAVLAILASPFALQVLRGRASSYATREQSFALQQDRLEASRTKHLAAIEADRDLARAELRREQAAWDSERDALELKSEAGWDTGRAMEEIAHWHRHEAVALTMRFNGLLKLLPRFAKGELGMERLAALLDQVGPAEVPPRVPPLREAAGSKTLRIDH